MYIYVERERERILCRRATRAEAAASAGPTKYL